MNCFSVTESLTASENNIDTTSSSEHNKLNNIVNVKSGKYSQLAVQLIVHGGDITGRNSGISEEQHHHHESTTKNDDLSNCNSKSWNVDDKSEQQRSIYLITKKSAKIIVEVIEKFCGYDNESLFMTNVQKFAFGLNKKKDSNLRRRLNDITTSEKDELFLMDLIRLPISEWIQ